MAEAILELAADPARRRRLGEVARQLALEHLDREAIIGRYEQRLTWLVSSQAAGARRRRAQAGDLVRADDRFTARTPAQLRRG
jgi:hypothetical protein